MTEKQFSRKKLSAIMTMDAYQKLQQWIIDKNPVVPYPLKPEESFYGNTSHRNYLSNYLESVIVQMARNEGWMAKKVETTGTKIKTKTGKEVYVKTRNRINKGEPDVQVILPGGRVVYFEVKVGKDRLSADQVKYIDDLDALGIDTYIIKTADDWLKLFDLLKRRVAV